MTNKVLYEMDTYGGDTAIDSAFTGRHFGLHDNESFQTVG